MINVVNNELPITEMSVSQNLRKVNNSNIVTIKWWIKTIKKV